MWITTRIRKHTHFIERNNTYGTSWAQRLHRPLFQTGNWEDRYECASTGEAEFVLLVACDTDKHHRGHGRPVTADLPIPSRTIHFLKLWCRLRREKQGCDHAADIFCQMLSPRTKKIFDWTSAHLNLNSLEQHHNAVHNVGSQMCFLCTWIRFPSANLCENQFDEDRKGTTGDSVWYDPPLIICQITMTVTHPVSVKSLLKLNMDITP